MLRWLPVIPVVLVAMPQLALAAPSGEEIALKGNGKGSVPCSTCHQADGRGMAAAGFPALAGLDAAYVSRQLLLIRDGQRPAPTMQPTVASLTDDEVAAVASWFAALPPAPPTPAAADPAATALIMVGDWPGRDLPACVSCHGPGARGVGPAFPALAGQHPSYLASQLKAWKQGTRTTDPGDLMGTVARKLTDAEIDALSTALSAMPTGGDE